MKMKLLLVALSVVIAQTGCIEPQKLHLTVYYESKCPDSRNFILNQLVPAVNSFSDYLKLVLVPFGKAQSVNNGRNGFECQHGPTECLGNIVQDCALNLMAGRPNTEIVKYVACEMKTLAGARGSFQCVQEANLPVLKVGQCLSSRQGINLQLHSEHLTNMVAPKFIPTVTFNGHFNQKIQDRAMEDLFGTVCLLIPEARPCHRLYNTSVLFKRH